MARRIFALFTLASFVIFSTSCVTWSRREVKSLPESLPENTPVLSVVKNSGQVFQFSKAEPGRVRGYMIVGTAVDAMSEPMDITGPFPSVKKRTDGTIYEVIDGRGRVYVVKQVLRIDGDRMTILAAESVNVLIPLAEVRVIEVKKVNTLLTVLAVLGGIAGGMLILLAIAINAD